MKPSYDDLPYEGHALLTLDANLSTQLYHALPTDMQLEVRSLLKSGVMSLRCLMILDTVYWRISPGTADEREAVLIYARDPE